MGKRGGSVVGERGKRRAGVREARKRGEGIGEVKEG